MCPNFPLALADRGASEKHHDQLYDAEPFEALYEMTDTELGQGKGGAVRSAVCKQSGRAVAVKTYIKQNLSLNQLSSMRSEISLLRHLSHPGIVKLEGAYESKEVVHVVMEQLHGGELFDLVQQREYLSHHETADIAVQLLKALSHLHSEGIVHRDVKLENVMIEGQNSSSIKLIDFGYSKAIPSGTMLVQACGTIGYAAPEILAGRPYDEKVDLWAAGVVIYTLLTGCPLEVNGRITFGREFRRHPSAAQKFVRSLLCADPQRRATAQEALKHPWLEQALAPQQQRTPPKAPAAQHALARSSAPALLFKVLTFGVLTICGGDTPHADVRDEPTH